MQKKFSHVCITTGDMQKSLNFYKKVMGLEAVHETDEWSELKLDDNVNLALYYFPGKKDVGLGFFVNDCKKATEKMIKQGVEVIKNSEKRDDGIVLTHFKDSDGYIHNLAEAPKLTKK